MSRILVCAVALCLCNFATIEATPITTINFSGIVTSATDPFGLAPTPVALGDKVLGFVRFQRSGTDLVVVDAGLFFPTVGISTVGGEGGGGGNLLAVSDGYEFFSGPLSQNGLGFDGEFNFTLFRDMDGSFFAEGSEPGDTLIQQIYEGRITDFSIPESGNTILLLGVAFLPLVVLRIGAWVFSERLRG